MSVSIDDVRHVAALARLGLESERLEALSRELSTILEHMEVLQRVDTESAEADDLGARGTLPLRPDSGPPIRLERLRQEFAPSMRDAFFMVPRLGTHEEEE